MWTNYTLLSPSNHPSHVPTFILFVSVVLALSMFSLIALELIFVSLSRHGRRYLLWGAPSPPWLWREEEKGVTNPWERERSFDRQKNSIPILAANLATFPDLPRLQFLTTCSPFSSVSDQKLEMANRTYSFPFPPSTFKLEMWPGESRGLWTLWSSWYKTSINNLAESLSHGEHQPCFPLCFLLHPSSGSQGLVWWAVFHPHTLGRTLSHRQTVVHHPRLHWSSYHYCVCVCVCVCVCAHACVCIYLSLCQVHFTHHEEMYIWPLTHPPPPSSSPSELRFSMGMGTSSSMATGPDISSPSPKSFSPGTCALCVHIRTFVYSKPFQPKVGFPSEGVKIQTLGLVVAQCQGFMAVNRPSPRV